MIKTRFIPAFTILLALLILHPALPPKAGAAPALTPLTPSVSISPELQQKVADLVKTYNDSLLVVTGNGGNGSGFVATMGSVSYIITNTHLMAAVREPAFKDLDDKTVHFGKASAAIGADVLRLEAQAGKPMELMQDVNQNASIGDDIVVLGNSEGAGVVNPIMGKIVGIGPNLIEIDAQIVPGDSGSPIVHLKSGKVIGIATFLSLKKYDPDAAGMVKPPVTRYFGYRLDSVKEWQPVNWETFYKEAAAIHKIQLFSVDLDLFYQDLSINGHVADPHPNPLIKERIDEWIQDKGHRLNAEDELRMNETFVSYLKTISRTDVEAARQTITYDYFQRKLTEVQQARAKMAAALEKVILHKQ